MAVKRNLLSTEQSLQVQTESERRGVEPQDLVIELGLLDATQVDVLETLRDPTAAIPGYEILEVIGQGALGVVYRARQEKLDRLVALKTIKLSKLDNMGSTGRSRIEALTTAKLRHPNIVAAYDYGVIGSRVYLAMELVEGEDLLDRIEREGPCEERLALSMIRQVASALAHASEEGVVHRDIKPANLLLTRPMAGLGLPTGVPLVKVTDFGLALQSDNTEQTRMTMAGTMLGTPCYAAPEQVEKSEVDERADIYALGATLFHMLSAQQPFGSATVMQILGAKMKAQDDWRDELPDRISQATIDLFRDMTEHDPERRLAEYGTLIDRIDEILGTTVVPGRTAVGESAQARKPPSRASLSKKIGATLAAIAIVVALAASLFWTSRVTPPVKREMARGANWYLFNGERVPSGEPHGLWVRAEDEEGSSVFTGSGRNAWKALNLKSDDSPPQFFELTFDVNPQECEYVDLQFGWQGDDAEAGPRNVIRVSSGSAEFGRSDSLKADFERSKAQSATSLDPLGGERNYYRVALSRQPDAWFADVEGQPVGAVPVVAGEMFDRVLLRISDSKAYFGNVRIFELTEPASDGEVSQ